MISVSTLEAPAPADDPASAPILSTEGCTSGRTASMPAKVHTKWRSFFCGCQRQREFRVRESVTRCSAGAFLKAAGVIGSGLPI